MRESKPVYVSQNTIKNVKKIQLKRGLSAEEAFNYTKSIKRLKPAYVDEKLKEFHNLVKTSFELFVKYVYKKVEKKPLKEHGLSTYVMHALQTLAFGDVNGEEYKSAVFNLSRGFGKSLFSTEYFPCFLLLIVPKYNILVTSISSKNNLTWHTKRVEILTKMIEIGLFPYGLKINNGPTNPSITITDGKNKKLGSIQTTSTYSTSVGGNFNAIISDDPEALSAAHSQPERETCDTHFNAILPMLRTAEIDKGNTLYFSQLTKEQKRNYEIERSIQDNETSKIANRILLVVQQRLYVGDVSSRMLKKFEEIYQMTGSKYLHVVIPAYWTDENVEYKSLYTGQTLFEVTMEKHGVLAHTSSGGEMRIYNEAGALGKSFAESTIIAIGEEQASAQLQQRPVDTVDQLFHPETIQFWNAGTLQEKLRVDSVTKKSATLKVERMCIITDLAFTNNDDSDYCVAICYLECREKMHILGETKWLPSFYVLDMYRNKTTEPQKDVLAFAKCWESNDFYLNLCRNKKIQFFIEAVTSNTSIINQYEENLGRGSRFQITKIKRGKSNKLARIEANSLPHKLSQLTFFSPEPSFEPSLTSCTRKITNKKYVKNKNQSITEQIRREVRDYRITKLKQHDDIIDCITDMYEQAYMPTGTSIVEAMSSYADRFRA
jgi:hypothetical protein